MRSSAEIKADIADRESQLNWAEKTGFFEDIDDNAQAVFVADKQAEIDDLHEELDEALAAALITAAPELLSSLKAMLDAYWGEGDGHPPPQFIADAINAIAKAEAA